MKNSQIFTIGEFRIEIWDKGFIISDSGNTLIIDGSVIESFWTIEVTLLLDYRKFYIDYNPEARKKVYIGFSKRSVD